MIDNTEHILKFCPDKDDGDTFIYTEMLDRSKRKGNNGVRLLKTFYHRSKEEFLEQIPTIKYLCDLSKVRAYTRLAPRSYKKVGETFTRLVVDASLTSNWSGMKSLYNRACGTTKPLEKLWLFDVDLINEYTVEFGKILARDGLLIETIPSRKGLHYIVKPHHIKESLPAVISLHKDNPTNLYIPDDAE